MSGTIDADIKIGLSLSGGAARCIAHLGVLEALSEMQIRAHAISAVSGGAIIAGFFANSFTPREILAIIKETSLFKVIGPAFNIGLLKMDKLKEIYSKYFKINMIEDLPVQLSILCCDIKSGKAFNFSSGDLITAIIASSSMPVVFKPVPYKEMLLVDGGILNNMPVQALEESDIIIGVNVNRIDPELEIDSLLLDMERNIDIIVTQNIQNSIAQCDVFIEPDLIKNYRLSDLNKADELFRVGYEFTLKKREQIQKMVQKKSFK